MAYAGHTKLYWYTVEMDKLEALGHSPAEAHKIVTGWLKEMEGIVEWYVPEEVKHD